MDENSSVQSTQSTPTSPINRESSPLIRKHKTSIFSWYFELHFSLNLRTLNLQVLIKLSLISSCFYFLWKKWFSGKELKPRTVFLGHRKTTEKYPANAIRNQKYNVISFLPLVLFEQFKFFLNLYFLIMALSQFHPDIRIGGCFALFFSSNIAIIDYDFLLSGYPYTYWGPLGFVLMVTICREAVDDFRRFKRDKEINSQKYKRLILQTREWEKIPSSKIKVGDIIVVEKDERVPADLILLRTTEKDGTVFIRTDQLDGETDWKLRLAVPMTQKLNNDAEIFDLESSVYIEKPQKDIHSFIGTFSNRDCSEECSLNIENTLWANTVIANGRASGVVIYTGSETRSVMNNSSPRSKVGLLDMEINALTKVQLFIFTNTL